jgi:RimK family alpha-L-glutamate ligase
MKKILFIGIGNEKDEKQRMTSALIEKGMEYIYARWSDLSFFGDKVYARSQEINFDEIGGVFFDIPRFPTTIKVAGEIKERIDFHLENEMHTLLTILKKKKIYAPNGDFFLSHPYYNKFSQAYIFADNGVAAIPTLHLCDNKKQKIAEIFAATNFDFPIVAKESYGGQGNKVWKIENQAELEEFIKDRRNVNVIFQPFVENNADYRVIVVGGECLGIMKRSAKEGEWKNNFSLGGEVAKHDDEEMQKFAIEACRKMNLDIAGLDIFSTDNGYLIIEANMFFGLDGFESVFQNLNVSGKILEMIINKTK